MAVAPVIRDHVAAFTFSDTILLFTKGDDEPRMEPPHLPTETLAASRARTARKWLSPVPRSMRMNAQARAISLIRAESSQRRGLAGGGK